MKRIIFRGEIEKEEQFLGQFAFIFILEYSI